MKTNDTCNVYMQTDSVSKVNKKIETESLGKAAVTQTEDVVILSKEAQADLLLRQKYDDLKEGLATSIFNDSSLDSIKKTKATSFIKGLTFQKYKELGQGEIFKQMEQVIKEAKPQQKIINKLGQSVAEKTSKKPSVQKYFVTTLIYTDPDLSDKEKSLIVKRIEGTPQSRCDEKGEEWLVAESKKYKEFILKSRTQQNLAREAKTDFENGFKAGFQKGFDEGGKKGVEIGVEEGMRVSENRLYRNSQSYAHSQYNSQFTRYDNAGFPMSQNSVSPMDFFRDDQLNPLNRGGNNLFGDQNGTYMSNIHRTNYR